jgi:hypothetical protein
VLNLTYTKSKFLHDIKILMDSTKDEINIDDTGVDIKNNETSNELSRLMLDSFTISYLGI